MFRRESSKCTLLIVESNLKDQEIRGKLGFEPERLVLLSNNNFMLFSASIDSFQLIDKYQKYLQTTISGISTSVIKENIKFLELLTTYEGPPKNISEIVYFLKEKGYTVYAIRTFQPGDKKIGNILNNAEKLGVKNSKYLVGIKVFSDDDTSHIIGSGLRVEKVFETSKLYYVIVENKSKLTPVIIEDIKNFVFRFSSQAGKNDV